MAVEIKMPSLGQTTNELKLIRWHVKEGQRVQKGEPLCEVETDKTTMDVESFAEGTILKLYAGPEDIISSGEVIAIIGYPEEMLNKGLPSKVIDKDKVESNKKIVSMEAEKEDETKDDRETSPLKEEEFESIKATKLVKNLAIKNNIDLSKVKGTGPRGIITKNDLNRYIESLEKKVVLKKEKEPEEVFTLTPNQQAVSANVSASKNKIPHYYLKTTAVVDNLLKKREESGVKGREKISTYTYFIHAVSKALLDFPRLKGIFRDNKVYVAKDINVGFAVAKDEELYVPVIKNTENKDIKAIDNEVKALIVKTNEGKLKPEDISGGTVTISNLGMFDIDEFLGIINYPQVVLITAGKIKKSLFIDSDNRMSIKNICTLSTSFDHRVVNGAQAAAFLSRLKKIIEEEL